MSENVQYCDRTEKSGPDCGPFQEWVFGVSYNCLQCGKIVEKKNVISS